MANLPVQIEKKKVERITDLSIKPKIKKKESKIEQLLEKPKLNNREMNQLSQLMAKEDNAEKPDSLKTLKLNDAVKVVMENSANKKDTTYWSEIRPIPLSTDEIASFQLRDSLALIAKKHNSNDSISIITHKKNYGVFNPLFFWDPVLLKGLYLAR